MKDTASIEKELIEKFDRAFEDDEVISYNGFDDIDPLLSKKKIIPLLIKRVDDNRDYRKKRFLNLVHCCSGCPSKEKDDPIYAFVAEKANLLLVQTREELNKSSLKIDDFSKKDLKYYLFDKEENELVIKRDTINRWFGLRGNTPTRHMLFLLSFALDLPLADTQDDYYSHESLFYRVFSQRSRSRNIDEIIMMYCKMTKRSYATAIKMYIDFLQRKKENQVSDKSIPKNNPATRIIYNDMIYQNKKLIDLTEHELVDFLLANVEYLDYKSSHVNRLASELQKGKIYFLDEIIEEYKGEIELDILEIIRDNYLDLYPNKDSEYMKDIYRNYDVLKNMDDRNKVSDSENKMKPRINKGTEVTSALPKRTLFANYHACEMGAKKETEEDVFFQSMDDKRKRHNELFKPFVYDVVPFSDYFCYISRYSEDYYTKQRKRWVFLLFLFYWSAVPVEYESNRRELFNGYIEFTNHILDYSYFSKLLPYNDFDALFILCSQRSDPIKDYLMILNTIYLGRMEVLSYKK